MTVWEFSLVFSLGLVSGLHCLQMCGPIVLSYSISMAGAGAGRRQMLFAHVSYNGGRIATYTLLGALAGGFGSAIGMMGRLAGLASAARILSGAAMVIAGILMARALPSSGLVSIESSGITARFSRAIGRLLMAPRAGGKFRLGLVLGFLPCGLIYAALLKSVETGAALAGALTMTAFGGGTAVALLSLGFASSMGRLRPGPWSTRLAAAGVAVFGAILIWRGLAGRPICHG